MMETYDNPLTQSPITTTNATNNSSSYSTSFIHPANLNVNTTTTIDSSGAFVNVSLLPWEVVADTFLKQLNGLGSSESGNGSSSKNGSGLSGSGVSAIQQLPFAAYQSVAAISTQPTGTDEQFHGEGGGAGAGPDSFVSWASTATPSQVFFIVKVVIMCFIIVSAVFGNLLVIVSVMRHRKLR